MNKKHVLFYLNLACYFQANYTSHNERPTPPQKPYVPYFNSTGPVSIQRPNGKIETFANYDKAETKLNQEYQKKYREYQGQLAAYQRAQQP